MGRKKQEVWTNRCKDGRACARIGNMDEVVALARKVGTAEAMKAAVRDMNTVAFCPNDEDICDGCLEAKYGLESRYDALDHMAVDKLYTEESVLKALRKAEREANVPRETSSTDGQNH